MESSAIANYIDGIETDHEPNINIPGLSIFKDHGLFAKKIQGSRSIQSNSVVGSIKKVSEEIVEEIFKFFGQQPFSWNVDLENNPPYLIDILESRGMYAKEHYSGMYKFIDQHTGAKGIPGLSILEVSDREEIKSLVRLTAEIWGIIDAKTRELMLSERANYLEMPGQRGGFFIAEIYGKPVGYSRYRISADGKALYLTGAGVLSEYRHKSIYSSLLAGRENMAFDSGCKVSVAKAKKDTSAPILEKHGYRKSGDYTLMAKDY